jgi:hypothetical protein
VPLRRGKRQEEDVRAAAATSMVDALAGGVHVSGVPILSGQGSADK